VRFQCSGHYCKCFWRHAHNFRKAEGPCRLFGLLRVRNQSRIDDVSRDVNQVRCQPPGPFAPLDYLPLHCPITSIATSLRNPYSQPVSSRSRFPRPTTSRQRIHFRKLLFKHLASQLQLFSSTLTSSPFTKLPTATLDLIAPRSLLNPNSHHFYTYIQRNGGRTYSTL
jgi:hypothetical protein